MFVQIDKASSAEDLLQLCLQALESENGEAGVRERLGLPLQDDSNNGKKRDGGAVQKALLQVGYIIPLVKSSWYCIWVVAKQLSLSTFALLA